MEKEKKKRVKKASATEGAQEVEKVETPVETVTEKPKKERKPRVKKTAEKVETPVVEVAEAPLLSEEEPTEKTQEKPKKARKPRTKKGGKTEEKIEEKVEVVEEEKAPEKHEMTRAEKKDAVRAIVKELLTQKTMRRAALIDEASKAYVERYPSVETVNVNDVKGRVGSVITLMEQAEEVFYVEGAMRLDNPEKEEKTEEKPVPAPIESLVEEGHLPVPAPESKLAPVFDLSAILGEKTQPKKKEKSVQKPVEIKTEPVEERKEESPAPKGKTGRKPVQKAEKSIPKKAEKAKPQDKLKERFLKKIRSHGGSYLEYYAVYLLQRYAQANGRRLEAMRVSGGEYDGGIDGEIELTDTFGFRETLYIQAKNWEPTDEKWMVGETLLQQFIGAIVYRMAKAGKAHARGVYVTTSRFSEGAKKMLDDMSDKLVGYDGDELFELAKECNFGVIQKDGEWALDEALLAGEKAFFNM